MIIALHEAMPMKFICSIIFVLFFSVTSFAQNYDVVIIGGGISGLSTAHLLQQKGVNNLLVLESEDRAGGKMWTQRGAQGDAYYERGAELVNTSDIELIELMKSLGVGLTERRFKRESRHEILMFKDRTVMPDGRINEGKVRPFTFEELVEKMNSIPADIEVLKKINELQMIRASDDKLAAKRLMNELRAKSARSLVENGIYTKALFEALMVSEMGTSLSEVNGEVLLDYVVVDKNHLGFSLEVIPQADEKFRITGGTDSVIAALEKKIDDKIYKNTRVEKVEQVQNDNFKISIRTGKNFELKEINAKHVVFAVPAYQLPKLNIVSSEVTPKKIQEAASLPFAHNAKIFLVFKEKFWDRTIGKGTFTGVGVLESGVQFWDTTENQMKTEQGVITLYPGEWPVNEKEQAKRLKEVLNELRAVPGLNNLDQYLKLVDVQNWQKSYAGVFNSNYTKNPKMFAEKLNANMYFVGADKDSNLKGEISESFGYMNGAVRTAIRATDRIKQKSHSLQKLMCYQLFTNAG